MTMYSMPQPPQPSLADAQRGSKDGLGCSDCDKPYRFGRRPRAIAPFPFTALQFGHLLALRGRIGDGLTACDDLAPSDDFLRLAS
jgi:hypothetical protein